MSNPLFPCSKDSAPVSKSVEVVCYGVKMGAWWRSPGTRQLKNTEGRKRALRAQLALNQPGRLRFAAKASACHTGVVRSDVEGDKKTTSKFQQPQTKQPEWKRSMAVGSDCRTQRQCETSVYQPTDRHLTQQSQEQMIEKAGSLSPTPVKTNRRARATLLFSSRLEPSARQATGVPGVPRYFSKDLPKSQRSSSKRKSYSFHYTLRIE